MGPRKIPAVDQMRSRAERAEAAGRDLDGVIRRLVNENEQLRDLLTEAHRQDYGTPGWRQRVRAATLENGS